MSRRPVRCPADILGPPNSILPLPRREHSARSDYHVLEGTNRHTIVANGWVHEEQNNKLVLDKNAKPVASTPYLAKEYGINRYERIVDFDFSNGDEYWDKTSPFWADVRSVWFELIENRESIKLTDTVNGRPLFVPLFERAQTIATEGSYNEDENRQFVRDTILQFVQ